MQTKFEVCDKIKLELKDEWLKNSQLRSHEPADFYYFLGYDKKGNILVGDYCESKPEDRHTFEKVYYKVTLIEKKLRDN